MGQARAEKPSFSFNKGLNSDAPALVFPPDFSTDEQNFEIMLDGTRRRRRGLEAESENVITITESEDSVVRTFKWKSVANNPDLNFHVWQIGDTLYFADDVPVPSSSMRNFTFDLTDVMAATWTDADVKVNLVDIAFGRGQAIVVGKCINPTLLTYVELTDSLTDTIITINERDFQGVEDGHSNTDAPAVITDAYLYNLLNEGWLYEDVLSYQADQAELPTKNMVPWMGYRRADTPGFNPDDGTKEFSSDKLVGELFQDAPAPRGHFIRSPFDTTVAVSATTDESRNYMLGGWNGLNSNTMVPTNPNDLNFPNVDGFPDPAKTLIQAEFTNQLGVDVGDMISFFVDNGDENGGRCTRRSGGDRDRWWGHSPFNDAANFTNGQGPYTVEETIGTHTIKFYLSIPDDDAGYAHGNHPGSWPHVYTFSNNVLINIPGQVINERPTCAAFFAGRAWYAGVPHPVLGDALFFSQVVEVDAQYGKAYQVADPTDQNISDLIDTDGGVFRIPEMGRCLKLLPYSSSLIVFATNGVWQVGPGQSGYFTATSYSIRKLSDVGCMTATSVVDAGIPCYWGVSGIFAIQQDTNTGFLNVVSISQDKIDVFYSGLGSNAWKTATGDFDRVNKRIIWVYRAIKDDFLREFALVYDIRFGSFTPWKFGGDQTEDGFNSMVYDIFTTTDIDENNSTLRFICLERTGGLNFIVARLTSLDYSDFSFEESAFLVTGFDTAQSPSRRKHAPTITVFMNRSEIVTRTGYLGQTINVTNGSSLGMQARWDWSDNLVAGKWGRTQEVYRHARPFVLADDVLAGVLADGTPIIATRNKVRGRGRSLHLAFTAGVGKDSHIHGWSINYTVLTEV